MLAGASVFWILFGALTTPVAAAGLTWHSESAAAAGDPDPSGGTDHHCGGQSFNRPGDDDRCCKQKCCASPPHPTRTPVPAATPTSIPGSSPTPATTASEARTGGGAAPAGISEAVSVACAREHVGAGGRPAAIRARAARAHDSRPPAREHQQIRRGSGGLDRISSVLVAATVAVASLALIRRPG